MSVAKHLVLLAPLIAAASPVGAQCRLCEQPTTLRTSDAAQGADVELRIETNLNFDRLILGAAGAGAVTIRPDGSTGTQGSVMQLGPRGTVGTVQVHGEPNRAVRVEIPHRIDLYSIGGGRMTLDDVGTDLGSTPHLDAAGNLSFRFGGRLIVKGGPPTGGPAPRPPPRPPR